jgi:S1-C subfamily serine protease
MRGQRIAGRLLEDFFLRHTAIVSDGAMPRVEESGDSGKEPRLRLPAGEGYGSAVSLGDGYFLTAAHVPVKGQGGLFCMEHGTRPVVRPYRLVWSDRAADVALLHAPVEVPAVKWTSGHGVAAGTRVFSFGFGGGEWKPSQGQVTGGKGTGEDDRHLDLKMSGPVVAGDSGGPVTTADGQLVGIVTRANYRWVRAFGRAWTRTGSNATRPDVAMLQDVIARDRDGRTTRHFKAVRSE